jgi:hypothetical protein
MPLKGERTPDPWILPPVKPALDLTEGELLLADWIICGASRLITEADTTFLVSAWEGVRLALWQAIDVAPTERAHSITINRFQVQALFAICPTTFRWGMGDDVGFSLKMKLARFLAPEMFHDHEDKTLGDAANATPDPTSEDAGL